jgi:co-chaperonin GroES (HSP10)
MENKMSNLTDAEGNVLVNVPSIKNIVPTGRGVLVEMLTSQEALGTSLVVQDDVQLGAPQAYILQVGPHVKSDSSFGLKAGDRVLLQGTFVPLPEYDDSHRPKGIVTPENIKAIIEE